MKKCRCFCPGHERLGLVDPLFFGSRGSIAIDDGGFMGPNYSEELNQKIDKAIKDSCPMELVGLLTVKEH